MELDFNKIIRLKKIRIEKSELSEEENALTTPISVSYTHLDVYKRQEISRITFATIGSVKNHPELFTHFKNIIVDECHLCLLYTSRCV